MSELTLNEAAETITINEFTFERNVVPVFVNLVNTLKNLEDNEIGEDKLALKKFLTDAENFGHSERVAILTELKNYVELDANYFVITPSIFDEEIIYEAICRYIEKIYGFDPRF